MIDTKIEKWAASLRGTGFDGWVGGSCVWLSAATHTTHRWDVCEDLCKTKCIRNSSTNYISLDIFLRKSCSERSGNDWIFSCPGMHHCLAVFVCSHNSQSASMAGFSCAATHIWRNKWLKTSNRKKTILFVTLFEQKHNFCVTKRNV